MTTLTTLRSVLEALTNTLPTMHKNTTTLGKVNYHAAKDAITDMTALIADMEKAEPVQYQHARDAITWMPETGYVFAAPQSKPLTDDQIMKIASSIHKFTPMQIARLQFARYIEEAHGIKE
jgi:hypothetical protein